MYVTRLLYFSESTIERSAAWAQVRDILATSQRRNAPAAITGALVFDDSWFIQALEGDRTAVWKTFKRIEEDDRHANVILVEAKEVANRLFGNWWMGLATRDERTVAAFAPYLRNGFLDPRNMTADDIVSLMVALCGVGLSRKLAKAA